MPVSLRAQPGRRNRRGQAPRVPKTPVVAIAAALALTAGCTGQGMSGPTTVAPVTTTGNPMTSVAEPQMSTEAEAYLGEALESMREHSINRQSVDWSALEQAAKRRASGAQTLQATYPAIELALSRLDDDHSIFLTPAEAADFSDNEPDFIEPDVEAIDEAIGYVAVYRFSGDIGDAADAYADSMATRIGDIDSGVCGWIVDLRSNTGGNMWPMIAGLAPILGKGTVGAFTYPDSRVEPWTITEEHILWGSTPMVSLKRFPEVDEAKPVAVLIGPNTASSGEATAVAFHGRDGTKLIGEPTLGLTTSNEPVELSDGALLILTMSSFTDRHGQAFGQDISVEPDITEPASTAETRAVEWLNAGTECRD
jgi:carboxyl-terminal processing protease